MLPCHEAIGSGKLNVLPELFRRILWLLQPFTYLFFRRKSFSGLILSLEKSWWTEPSAVVGIPV